MPSPHIEFPAGRAANVSIIDSTLRLSKMPMSYLMTPPMEGFVEMPTIPTWSFLIESSNGRKALFDLGVPPDTDTFAPIIREKLKASGWDVKVEKHVAKILEENGANLNDINSIIWRYESLFCGCRVHSFLLTH
jgi:hypothetical protein